MKDSRLPRFKRLITQICLLFFLTTTGLAQESSEMIEYILDVSNPTQPLPKVFSVNLNLSNRENLTSQGALEKLEKEIGFANTYRLIWDFWQAQEALIKNYETIIKKISDSGGTVIISLINTPRGLGKTLDKRSPPEDLAKWRELVKDTVKNLSCDKKYNIWYEVWSNPTEEKAFLGTKEDYFNLYKAVGRVVLELERQYNINIPLGGPAVGNWYDNFETNTPLTPERSLIYDLMRYCSQNNLPLDFISWHAYSTEPDLESQVIAYNRTLPKLIKEWQAYFNFKEVAIVIDEWNWGLGEVKFFDERGPLSYIAASYIPGRLKNMYEAGIDKVVFYNLEDFQDDSGKVISNFGLLYTRKDTKEEKISLKATYLVFKYIALLGKSLYPEVKISDEFVNALATKKGNSLVIMFWHYVDPFLLRNQLERIFLILNEREQNTLIELIKANRLKDILNKASLPAEFTDSERLRQALDKLVEFNQRAKEAQQKDKKVLLKVKNIRGRYQYSYYVVDKQCNLDCEFKAQEQKKLNLIDGYEETLTLSPYSVALIVFNKIGDGSH